MKKSTSIFVFIVLLLNLSWLTACEFNSNEESATDKDEVCDEYELQDPDFPCLNNLPIEALSDEEEAGLLFMREEEKLARDVYVYLYDLYPLPVFNNISKSEQRHTDAIKNLIDRYELEDPVSEDFPGVFKDKNLQSLYDELIKGGSIDRVSALMAGALIEETDILDIVELTKTVDNQDITMVYNNLLRGSHNHLKAFVNVLKVNGVNYEPVLLSQEHFDSIVF